MTRGSLVGRNRGRVSEISPDALAVEESYRDYAGRKFTHRARFTLAPSAPVD